MNIAKRLIVNTFTGWGSKFVSICIAIFTTPILLSALGKYDYGLWVTLGQGAGLIWMLDFGTANSVCRFITKANAKGDVSETIGIYSTALLMFFLFSFLSLIITIIFSFFIVEIFSIQESKSTIALFIFLSLCLNICISFPLRIGRGLLQSIHRYDIIDYASIITNFLQFIAIVIAYACESLNLIFLSVLSIATTLSLEAGMFLIAKKNMQQLKVSIAAITKIRMIKILSLGLSSFSQSISGMIYTRGQTLFVGIILGISNVPLFSIPLSLMKKVGPIIGHTGATFTPFASSFDSQKDIKSLHHLSMMGFRYSLTIGLCIGIYVILFGKDLITVWLGNSSITASDINIIYYVMAVMTIPLVFARANKCNQTILNATGYHWFVSNSLLVFSILGILVSIYLMLYTNLGILGATVGWSIKAVFAEIILFTIYLLKKFKISAHEYLKVSYMPPVVAFLLVYILTQFLFKIMLLSGLTKIIIISILYFLLAFFVFYFLGFTKKHRIEFNNIMRKYFSVIKEKYLYR